MPNPNGDLPEQGDAVPNPDPTRLTTQLVDRAISSFREVVDTQLDARQRATDLVADNLEKIQRDFEQRLRMLRDDRHAELTSQREYILALIDNVKGVNAEKFDAISTQFAERDTRTEQAAQESRISLDAALAAAKEAVSEQNKANTLAIGKSEDATKERLDSLATLGGTTNVALQAQITDLKSRLDRGEGAGVGANNNHIQTREASTDARTLLFGIISAFVGIGGIVLAIVAFAHP